MKRIGKRPDELDTIIRSRPLAKTVHLLFRTVPWYFIKYCCVFALALVTIGIVDEQNGGGIHPILFLFYGNLIVTNHLD